MYLWIICAENLLWFIVEIQVEILLSPAQLCLCCPAAGWDRSADLFDSKEFAIPENGRLPKLICSGNYQDQLEITWKKAASTEFLLLKTCRKPLMAFLWLSLASVLQWFFPRGLIFFYTHFYSLEVSPGQKRRISCFCLGVLACSASRNHGDAPWGGRLPFSTHSKVWFFGVWVS